MDAVDGREVGEALESPRERNSILHPDVCDREHCEGYGIPKLAQAAMCLNSSHHKAQYTLLSSYSKFYLLGAAKKRKKQGGDMRKGTISPEGSGRIEGTEPKRL